MFAPLEQEEDDAENLAAAPDDEDLEFRLEDGLSTAGVCPRTHFVLP